MYYNIHCHQKNQDDNVLAIQNLSINPNNVSIKLNNFSYYSAGIHPWDVDNINLIKSIHYLDVIANNSNVIAIGETGLDRSVKFDFSKQQQIFKHHIELSEYFKKPLIIHCVKAFDTLLHLHKIYYPKQIWIVHGFNNHEKIAKQLISRGIKISLGMNIFKKPDKNVSFIANVSPNDFFMETDTAPSTMIFEVYKKISSIRNQSLISLIEDQEQNFLQTFKNISYATDT